MFHHVRAHRLRGLGQENPYFVKGLTQTSQDCYLDCLRQGHYQRRQPGYDLRAVQGLSHKRGYSRRKCCICCRGLCQRRHERVGCAQEGKDCHGTEKPTRWTGLPVRRMRRRRITCPRNAAQTRAACSARMERRCRAGGMTGSCGGSTSSCRGTRHPLIRGREPRPRKPVNYDKNSQSISGQKKGSLNRNLDQEKEKREG